MRNICRTGEEGGKPVLTKPRGQKKDVEAEILRNIDEEVVADFDHASSNYIMI